MNDVSRYPDLIPGLEEARLVQDSGDRRLVYLRHQYSFVSASYYAHVTREAEHHTLHFELDRSRPHDVRAGRGFITVDEFRGGSMVTWGVRADVGNALLTGVFAPVIHDWINERVWASRQGFRRGSRPTNPSATQPISDGTSEFWSTRRGIAMAAKLAAAPTSSRLRVTSSPICTRRESSRRAAACSEAPRCSQMASAERTNVPVKPPSLS